MEAADVAEAVILMAGREKRVKPRITLTIKTVKITEGR